MNSRLLLWFWMLGAVLIFNISAKATIKPVAIDTTALFPQLREAVPDSRQLSMKSFFFDLLWLDDSTFYYQPQGTYYLYKVVVGQQIEIQQLSKAKYHGNSFLRYHFLWDSTVYMYSGAGMFGFSNALLYFDFERGEWIPKPIEGQPVRAKRLISTWHHRDTLFAVMGVWPSSNHYFYLKISMPSFSCIEAKEIEHNDIYPLRFEHNRILSRSDRYYIFDRFDDKGQRGFYLYDRIYCEHSILDFLKNVDLFGGASSIALDDTIIYKYNPSEGWQKSSIERTISIDRLLRGILENQPAVTEENDTESWIAGSILLMFVFIALYFSRFSKEGEEEQQKAEILAKLKLKRKSNLTREELDEILNLTHLTTDSAKVMRSRWIKTLNASEEISIERVRNSDDKRMFLYSIN